MTCRDISLLIRRPHGPPPEALATPSGVWSPQVGNQSSNVRNRFLLMTVGLCF